LPFVLEEVESLVAGHDGGEVGAPSDSERAGRQAVSGPSPDAFATAKRN
jgi:hypothetical protein